MSVLFHSRVRVGFMKNGLPWSLEAKAVQYNKSHLSEAGLDARPDAMSSWDDLVAYLHSNGGQFYNESSTKVAFNNPRGVEALDMMRRFQHEYDVTRPGAAWVDIANQSASMVIGDTSATGRIRAVSPDFESWIEMIAIPPGPQGEHASMVSWSNMFVIPTGAKNPDLGWKFIEMWLSEEKVVERFKHIGGSSVTAPRRDFFQSNAFVDSFRDIPYMANMPEIFGNAGPYPHIRYTDISSGISSLFTRAERDGTLSPQSALIEAERIANAVLGSTN